MRASGLYGRLMRTRFALTSLAVVALLLSAPVAHAASAVGACADVGPTTTVVRGSAFLESSAFDTAGRLIYDDWISGTIRALDTPRVQPRGLGRMRFPGGIAHVTDGRIAVTEGNLFGRLFGGSSVWLLDTTTGAKTRIASRMVGANGLTRASDGTLYASDTPTGSRAGSPSHRRSRSLPRLASSTGPAPTSPAAAR